MEEESKSIEFRHPEHEESFSFSSCCHDFNSSSSFLFFSSDNEDNIDCEDDDESYIEIALEPAPAHAHKNKEDQEMELRISFSSSIPLSAMDTKSKDSYESPTSCISSSLSSSSTVSSSTFTFSSSFTESQRNQEVESKACDCRVEKKTTSTKSNKMQFPAVKRFISTFISSFRLSPETDIRDNSSSDSDTNQLDLVPCSNSRKNASKMATTRIDSTGMMMNIFVKFRAVKLKTLLASFLKASHINPGGYRGKKPEEAFRTYKYGNLVKPIDRGSTEGRRRQGNGERSRMLELNLDAIRGYVLEAMNISSFGRRDRRTKSCPVSTKSSPIHQRFLSDSYKMSATDSSIQAAIAHCKRSFGPKV